MNQRTLREIQRARLRFFPKDRICFYSGAAGDDQKNFGEWKNGKITFEQLRARVARDNFLPQWAVTEENLKNELRITGWMNSENL